MLRVFGITARVLVVMMMGGSAVAADAVVELGDARVTYDDGRWRAVERHALIEFAPQGKNARRMDGAELRVIDGGNNSCSELALQAFDVGHYDTEGLTSTPVTVGGIAGERFEAHTRCRNATPRGVVICVKNGAYAYLLQSLNAGCRGNNLFSGIDPLHELAEGIKFGEARR